MNTGIIRCALTTKIALELEYREPSVSRELDLKPSRQQDCLLQGDCSKIEFANLLGLI
jgi:hypothetical protein